MTSKILINYTYMLSKQKQFTQIINFLQPILERYKHTGDVKLLAVILHNLATAYAEQEYFQKAITHYEEVIKLTKGRYPDQQAEALYEIGIVHLKQRKFPQASAHLQEALEIWQQLSSPKVDKAKALIAVAIVEQSATG